MAYGAGNLTQMNAEQKQLAEDILDAAIESGLAAVDGVCTGKRVETGSTEDRALSLTATVIVGSPQPLEDPNGAISKNIGFQYEIKVGRKYWKDHTPPQMGDVWTFDGYPTMKCAVQIPTLYGWILYCRSNGGV